MFRGMSQRKITAPWVRACKGRRKLAVVTAYDATFAGLLDRGGADILLVGDSLGMVIQGRANTLPVTLEEVAYHTRAVARATARAQIVADLPFMTYQASAQQALQSAGMLVKEGAAEAVKLEGGVDIAESVRKIVSAGIPVMGHVGLTPQSVHRMGGFRVQGRSEETARRVLEDARALVDAGVYSIVVEGVPSDVGAAVSRAVAVPTIGIGAGPGCDGQVLVCYDFLGLFQNLSPKFVKRYAELGEQVVDATRRFVEETRSGAFPAAEHSFAPNKKALPPSEDTGTAPLPEHGPHRYGPADERGGTEATSGGDLTPEALTPEVARNPSLGGRHADLSKSS
jgi:3-methyl-2-oxobutanoate hydroxymethyltransferase